MGKKYDFDYIVIGSGPAGRTVAEKLAKAKKKVAIVEGKLLGGAEINTRDLPYRTALEFAKTYHKFMNYSAVSGNSTYFNLPTLASNINSVVQTAGKKIEEDFTALEIKIINGFANFLDAHTIAVDDKEYTATNFILATGSQLKANEISGLESVDYMTPDLALRVRRLPRFVFVVGGGPTGVQIAEYFAKLGTGVIIMERGTHLLPREDDEVGELIANYFTESLGITVVTNAKVLQITEDHMSKVVVFTNGAEEKMVRVDSVALATGSEPFLDYGLENAGVDYKRGGIKVDKYFNTSAKNIYAIGDCLGNSDSSSERANLEASILAENILHRQKFTAKYSGLVRRINTGIPIAVVGMNERDTLARDIKCKRATIRLEAVPTISYPEYQKGFVKILADHSGHLIGATIAAPNAEDLINELSLVLSRHLTVEALATTPHPLDTPAAAISLAAKKLLSK